MPHAHSHPLAWGRPIAGWPVWLLVFAWLCANCPPELSGSFAHWAGDARTFSHQERLREEVSLVLSGKSIAPSAPAVAAKPTPSRPAVPPVVGEGALKKIHFYPALSVRMLPPAARDFRRGPTDNLLPDPFRTEPPVPPPRRATI